MRCLRILLDRVSKFVKIKISVPCSVWVEDVVVVFSSETGSSGGGTIKTEDQAGGFFSDFHMADTCRKWI